MKKYFKEVQLAFSLDSCVCEAPSCHSLSGSSCAVNKQLPIYQLLSCLPLETMGCRPLPGLPDTCFSCESYYSLWQRSIYSASAAVWKGIETWPAPPGVRRLWVGVRISLPRVCLTSYIFLVVRMVCSGDVNTHRASGDPQMLSSSACTPFPDERCFAFCHVPGVEWSTLCSG